MWNLALQLYATETWTVKKTDIKVFWWRQWKSSLEQIQSQGKNGGERVKHYYCKLLRQDNSLINYPLVIFSMQDDIRMAVEK